MGNQIVRLLLEANADAEVKNSKGKTALHWATRNGHEVVVQLLETSTYMPY
jgi:ankyrin repeat protein